MRKAWMRLFLILGVIQISRQASAGLGESDYKIALENLSSSSSDDPSETRPDPTQIAITENSLMNHPVCSALLILTAGLIEAGIFIVAVMGFAGVFRH